jgi:hypothetical protein
LGEGVARDINVRLCSPVWAAVCPPGVQAKESGSQVNIVIDKEDVLTKIGDLLKKQDLSRYVL